MMTCQIISIYLNPLILSEIDPVFNQTPVSRTRESHCFSQLFRYSAVGPPLSIGNLHDVPSCRRYIDVSRRVAVIEQLRRHNDVHDVYLAVGSDVVPAGVVSCKVVYDGSLCTESVSQYHL